MSEKLKAEACVYMRRDGARGIVAAMLYNEHGILYEDSSPSVVEPPEPAPLGVELKKALARTTRVPKDMMGWKLTDWPSFKAGGEKSVRAFEAAFIPIRVSGCNEANLVFRAEGFPEKEFPLQIACTFSNNRGPEEVGNLLVRVFQACRDRRF